MRIMITERLSGNAPESVRNAWVGVMLTVQKSNRGYKVSGRAAIDALETEDHVAALWYRQNASSLLQQCLTIPQKLCCVISSDNSARVPMRGGNYGRQWPEGEY